MSKLHRFVVTSRAGERWYDTAGEAFCTVQMGETVYVTYEPTGLRVRVLRP